jgi:integral membrane protein
VKSALTRYRIFAYATGVFLLLLSAHVVLQFAQAEPGAAWYDREGLGAVLPGGGTWVPLVHGYLYLAYVIITADLWFRSRLPVGRTILVLLAGTVPFMSFVAERWVRGRVEPLLEADGTTSSLVG